MLEEILDVLVFNVEVWIETHRGVLRIATGNTV